MIRVNRIYRPLAQSAGPAWRMLPTTAVHLNPEHVSVVERGEVYDHDQLNDATHEHLHEVFGVANMRTFQQITRILREGHVVAADGADVYLPQVDRFRMPIAFLHGANNRLFLPEGSRLTYDLLVEHHGPGLHTRHVIDDYAHMDLFIGKDAARDVYRHPKETLALFGVERSMTVAELWPGGGWYTNILGPVLAERGRLVEELDLSL